MLTSNSTLSTSCQSPSIVRWIRVGQTVGGKSQCDCSTNIPFPSRRIGPTIIDKAMFDAGNDLVQCWRSSRMILNGVENERNVRIWWTNVGHSFAYIEKNDQCSLFYKANQYMYTQCPPMQTMSVTIRRQRRGGHS
jgi:hypothetical protein